MIDLCEGCHEPLAEERADCMTGYCGECSDMRCEECEELFEDCVCEEEEKEAGDPDLCEDCGLDWINCECDETCSECGMDLDLCTCDEPEEDECDFRLKP